MSQDNFAHEKVSVETDRKKTSATNFTDGDYGSFSENNESLQLPEHLDYHNANSFRKTILYYVVFFLLTMFLILIIARLMHFAVKKK